MRECPRALPEIQVLPNPMKDSRHPYIMTCTHPDCVTRLASRDLDHALWQWNTHLCPWRYDTSERIQNLKNSKSLFTLQWEELDRTVAEFMKLNAALAASEATVEESSRALELRGAISAHAFHVHLWMQPIFADTEAVKHEAMKRYKLHAHSEPTSTPGVDYDWRPATPVPGTSPAPAGDSVPVTALPAQTRSVAAITEPDPAKRAKVLKMWQSGIDVPSIAKLTGLTVSQVESVYEDKEELE